MTYQVKIAPPLGPVTITLKEDYGVPQYKGDKDTVAFIKSMIATTSSPVGHCITGPKLTAQMLEYKLATFVPRHRIEITEGGEEVAKQNYELRTLYDRTGKIP